MTREQAIRAATDLVKHEKLEVGEVVSVREILASRMKPSHAVYGDLWIVEFEISLPDDENLKLSMDTILVEVNKKTGVAAVFTSL